MDRKGRIEILKEKLSRENLQGAIITYSRNVLYYTGTAQPAWLVVTPLDYVLSVRSGYDFAVREAFIPQDRIREERKLDRVAARCFAAGEGPGFRRIGVESDIWTWDQSRRLLSILPDKEFVNLSPLILDQRKTKDPGEIRSLRKACDVIHKGHEAVLECLREGITELELAAAVENAHRLAGHEGIFFIRQPDFVMGRGPLSSGPDLFRISGVVYTITGVGLSPAVPAGPSRRRISRGDIVMVDIPVLVEGYHGDQTRTYVAGRACGAVQALYDDLRRIADDLIESIYPGIPASDISRRAFVKARELGREKPFQNFGNGRHSRIIGHGVGLELNEPPIL
ncbi:MAG TPA: Xaa-Pro peptidase family protein, partial [Syntrophales bacterium]|nr:Xaa-Pro peptidase family protein [Syntrophales bacterium]